MLATYQDMCLNRCSSWLNTRRNKSINAKEVDKSKVAFSIYTEPTFVGKRGTIMFANPRYSAHNIELEVRVDNKVIIRTQKYHQINILKI